MDRNQLKDMIQGTPAPIPTPFDNDYKLDLSRMSDMTQWWVEQGLGTKTTAFKVASAVGSGPDLSDDEWPHLLRTVVNSAGPDATVLCALKSKDTMHTIEDAKKAQDLGAVGLQIDLPFFHHMDQDGNIRHFSAISDAIDIGIMIYNTWWFCFSPENEYITAETMLRMKDLERLVAIKWSVPPGEDFHEMSKFSNIFNVIDNYGDYVGTFKNGGHGYISEFVCAYPKYDIELLQLLKSGNYDRAEKMITRTKEVFDRAGTRSSRILLEAMGHPMGKPRLPSLAPSESQVKAAKEALLELGWII